MLPNKNFECFADVKDYLIENNVPFDRVYQNTFFDDQRGEAYYFNYGYGSNYAVWFPNMSVQVFDTPRKDDTKEDNRIYVFTKG